MFSSAKTYLLLSLLKALASRWDVVGDLGVDDATGAFSVTTYDANHCPGNVSVLIIPFLSVS